MKFAFILCLIAIIATAMAGSSHGFNDNINWVNSIEEAQTLARQQDKPILILIHKTWCGACKRLKSQFASTTDEKLFEKADKFVMVNLEDNEEPKDAAYAPDGGYIPRIIYADKNGNVRPEISNIRRPDSYKYFYSDIAGVVSGMDRALEQLK
jgi:protein-disulfide reductase (glutathione)